jgi:hypothetical protein
MYKIKLPGPTLAQVFNSSLGCVCIGHSIAYITKRPNLKLKTRPKQLLGSLPLAIALPCGGDKDRLLFGSWPPTNKVKNELTPGFLAGGEGGGLGLLAVYICMISLVSVELMRNHQMHSSPLIAATRVQCYKTFFVRKLRIFVIS